MERLDHVIIPAGYHGIRVAQGIEKIAHNPGFDAGHITGGNKQRVTVCCPRPCMQPTDRADTFADVGDAAYAVQVAEPFALIGILCHEYDFVNDLVKGIDEPFDEGPVFVHEEVLLLPVGTPGFPPYEDHCRSGDYAHLFSLVLFAKQLVRSDTGDFLLVARKPPGPLVGIAVEHRYSGFDVRVGDSINSINSTCPSKILRRMIGFSLTDKLIRQARGTFFCSPVSGVIARNTYIRRPDHHSQA